MKKTIEIPSAGSFPGFRLGLVETPDEMNQVEALQRAIWSGESSVVPAHLLLTAAHNGGLVAAAWDGDRPAGFVFGFPGLIITGERREVKHCSHELGVHPDYRNAGLGFALKRLQWQFVRNQGLKLVTWTYDPLMAPNARLNIAKLGAVCNTYLRDVYGQLQDDLNAGLPTDRLQVDWWVDSDRVVQRMTGNPPPVSGIAERLSMGAQLLNPRPSAGALRPPESPVDLPAGAEELLLEIPPDFLALKAADPEGAFEWRMATRAAFEELFEHGYLVVDVASDRSRLAYVLQQP